MQSELSRESALNLSTSPAVHNNNNHFFVCIIDHKYNPRRLIFLDVGVQTAASCDAESITIKDPVSGSVQCNDCLKCPAGEGLSVSCGDVIAPSTSIVCKPCVLGETYSSAYEAGACKDCENCGPYRETIKACTLTSKAVCGKCKVGAYEEPMLTMCKPCSPCCNDERDIVISQCQVSEVPAQKHCSFARSAKCSKVATTASASTVAPTVETNHSTAGQSAISSTVTSPINKPDISTTAPALQTTWPSTVPIIQNETEASILAQVESAGNNQQVYPSEIPTRGATNVPPDSSSKNWAIVAIIGAVIVGVLFLMAVKCIKAKSKQVCKTDDIEMQRVQTDDEVNDSDGDETDEANAEDTLLPENMQVLLLHGAEKALDSPLLTGTNDDKKTQQARNEIDEQNPEEAQVPFSVQETPSDSPLPTGTQDDSETRAEGDKPNLVGDLLEDTQESKGVEETLDSPLRTGTEETQEPGPHGGTGKPQECLLMSIIFDT